MKVFQRHIFEPISIAPLAVFRALFGGIMFISIVRFALKGWIEDLYIEPVFYFPFYGFEWVQPLGPTGMYLLFAILGISSLGIMLGGFYRISTVVFFLTFTYVELIDKSNYLNHYYFVSLIGFLLIWVPAHRYFSLDVWRRPKLLLKKIPAWNLNVFKLQIGLVYVYAGIAKLHSEWLFRAMPLKLWLPAKSDLPILGPLLEYEWIAYAFSWFGAFYDLFIVFFLLYRPTRLYAYGFVIAFHMMTALLFQIGMFPYIMTLSALIFFSPQFHRSLIDKFWGVFQILALKSPLAALVKGRRRGLGDDRLLLDHPSPSQPAAKLTQARLAVPLFPSTPLRMTGGQLQSFWSRGFLEITIPIFFAIYFLFQLLLPFRYTLYPGNLFWTEQGYRFSWRVMLMEKAGYTVFNVHDPATGKFEQTANYEYLTPNQEKMMSTQPDMILQFAHFLYQEYQKKGFKDPVITAESFVTLNGRRSRRFVNPKVNLAKEPQGLGHKSWILPFETNVTE